MATLKLPPFNDLLLPFMVQASDLSTGEVQTGESGVQGQVQL